MFISQKFLSTIHFQYCNHKLDVHISNQQWRSPKKIIVMYIDAQSNFKNLLFNRCSNIHMCGHLIWYGSIVSETLVAMGGGQLRSCVNTFTCNCVRSACISHQRLLPHKFVQLNKNVSIRTMLHYISSRKKVLCSMTAENNKSLTICGN